MPPVTTPELFEPILAYAQALDRKDWATARACFMPEVHADYRDLRGTRETLTADAFVAKRQSALSPLQTRHVVTPLAWELRGEEGFAHSLYRIERLDPRRPAPNHFHTEGEYEHRLRRTRDGWRIAAVKQTIHLAEGNPSVHAGCPEK